MLQRCVSAAVMLFASMALVSCKPPNYPTKPVELKYYGAGPWAVTVAIGAECCDSSGDKFDLYYPINALIKSAGTIKTVLPIELPGQQFCADLLNCADTSHLTQGSIFLVDGSLDIPISPPTQPPSATGLQSIAAYYSAVPRA